MIRAIVVDDEKPSREVICNYIKEYCNDIHIVATASSVKTAFKVINRSDPDLVFLDIELGDGNGLDLLRKYNKIEFRVIFVTAYSEHAIKAFRFNAVDYLLKPIKIDELKEAVEKMKNLRTGKLFSSDLADLLKNVSSVVYSQPTLAIPNLKGFEVMKISEIIMCKADGYCTNFYIKGDRKIISSKNLKFYENLLKEHNFIRVHHSFIINPNNVINFTKQGEVILAENNKAYLGDAYKNDFLKLFIKK